MAKYKILHLPTASYLYKEINKDYEDDDCFTLYSDSEVASSIINNTYNLKFSSLFKNKNEAIKYINYAIGHNAFCFTEFDCDDLLKEHCEIIKVDDV